MIPEKTRLIYFSPTGTSRKILEHIAQGMGRKTYSVLDITGEAVRNQPAPELADELVLIGAPVYSGRVAPLAAAYFKQLKANKVPAILVVLYGNREYEDALVELGDICADCGICPLAAAAFIGEHSFSHENCLIAPGRPDADDLALAEKWGEKLGNMLEGVTSVDGDALELPGNRPYREGKGAAPISAIQVSEACTGCETCMDVCPVDGVDPDTFASVANVCIMCCACVRACPENARSIAPGPFMDVAQWLHENFSARKEPEFFGCDPV